MTQVTNMARRIVELEEALERIRLELGKPQELTPTPVANAYYIATDALGRSS